MPTFRENLRALPRSAWILFAGTFINRFGTFVMPFLAIYLTREGYSATQAGIAVSTYGAGHLVASFLGGHLADRVGRRNTIVLSMFSSSMAMVALSQASTFPSIVTLTFLVGLTTELYRPAATALLADLVEPPQRVVAFGIYRLAINLGFAAGPATAGFLANRSFLLVFAGDALTSAVFGCVALLALPHGLRSPSRDQSPAEGLRVAMADRAFVIFLAATLCLTWVEFQLHSTWPLHLTRLGHSPSTYGALLSINGVMIVLFELALTAWTQRFPPTPLIALGYGLTGVGLALTGVAAGIPALAATVVVWTLGEMIYAPVTGAYVAGLAPERFRGRYMGLWHSTWSIGMILGPATGTWIYDRNPAALWWTCLLLGATGAALSLMPANGRRAAVTESVPAE